MKNQTVTRIVFVLAALLVIVTYFNISTALSEPIEGTQQTVPELSEGNDAEPAPPVVITRDGSMTLDTMREIVKRLDANVQEPRPGAMTFVINGFQVAIFTAEPVNRMRVMVRIKSAKNMTREELLRISQANLDSALDARYAIGRGVLWATYIHPLSNLYPNQFIEAIGSTVNLAATYGTTYSSGQLFFGGGDSQGILGRQLIDRLLEKGQPI